MKRQKSAIFAKKKFKHKYSNDKNDLKVKYHCHYIGKYRGAAYSICNFKISIHKEIPAVFHNQSHCDYHFIIKKLAKKCKMVFNCLGKNTKKYKTFSVPITKEVKRTNKNGKEIT